MHVKIFNDRAGRLLWFDKETEIQDKDIKRAEKIFSEAISYIENDKVKSILDEWKNTEHPELSKAEYFDKIIDFMNWRNTMNDLEVDCISRKDVLKLMQDNWHTHNGDWAMQESMDDIRALPSVTPQEPRKGHWIDKQHLCGYCSAECSSCHKRSNGYVHDNGFSLEHKYYDFCPNCGADMSEVDNGNDD